MVPGQWLILIEKEKSQEFDFILGAADITRLRKEQRNCSGAYYEKSMNLMLDQVIPGSVVNVENSPMQRLTGLHRTLPARPEPSGRFGK